MYCPNCNKEYDSKFCPECGTKLVERVVMWCSNCNKEHDSKFCPECGARIVKKAVGEGVASQAAEQDDAEALYRLGLLYYYYEDEDGDPVPVESVNFFRKAAKQGHSSAQYYLGKCYYDGLGVDEDEEEAAKWWLLAAEQGHADAQYQLGECYFWGRGVDEDEDESSKWYQAAVESFRVVVESHRNAQGDTDAFNTNLAAHAWLMLGLCYQNGTGVEEDLDRVDRYIDRSKRMYLRLAREGDSDAQYNLGLIFGEAVGSSFYKGDEQAALLWLQKAAEQGHFRAKEKIELLFD